MSLPSLTEVLSVLAIGTISAATFVPQYPLILEKQRFKADIASVENLQKQYDVMKFETATDQLSPDQIWEALESQGYIPSKAYDRESGFSTQTEGQIVFDGDEFYLDCEDIPQSEYTAKIFEAFSAEENLQYLKNYEHLKSGE